MSDPFDSIDTAPLGIVCAIALVSVYAGARLIKAVGPADREVKPIRLELPVSKPNAKRLVEDWGKRGVLGAVKRWVYADFLFLLAYAIALAAGGSLAGRAAAAALDADPSDVTTVGAAFTYAGLIAGGLDVIENGLMLRMIAKHWGQPIPAATTLVSGAKWLLLVIAVPGTVGLLIASAVAELI
jgi:hypothetical protein